jgi:type IV pilus assembly protein PilC
MISVGEETGSLPELLDKIAEFYEDEVSTMSKTLTSMIEPILLIFVGLVVGGMLVALYIPIFYCDNPISRLRGMLLEKRWCT